MRAAGILLPIFSLPSDQGIGTLGQESYDFADWLQAAGQRYWQILPLGPTGYGDSPYQPFSTFAGNPYLIDLHAFSEDVLPREKFLACDLGGRCDLRQSGDLEQCSNSDQQWAAGAKRPAAGASGGQFIDYGKLYQNKLALLYEVYQVENYLGLEQTYPDFTTFCNEQADWLEDYVLFMALKEAHGGTPWYEWEDALRQREPEALETARRELGDRLRFHCWLQFHFDLQCKKLKAYVNEKGIQLIGDLPIYVALDSADVWSHPELFQMDEERRPRWVAGVPPDAFSATGQLWGNPLYDWKYHRQTGYQWWLQRIAHCFEQVDVLRLDHFRGFDAYYCVPAGDATAENGHWEDGPGTEFFAALQEALPNRQLIAEDLGFLTERVRDMLSASGFPGMKVLEFAFSADGASAYLPHRFVKNCVVYTGTHDNETLEAWFDTLPAEDLAFLTAYLDLEGSGREAYRERLIRAALGGVADTVIIPFQDWKGLGSEARINEPSTFGKNWKWRMQPGMADEALAEKICRLTALYGRMPADR